MCFKRHTYLKDCQKYNEEILGKFIEGEDYDDLY